MSFQLQFVFALILISLISIKCNDSDEEPVELMTTQEPIDTANDLHINNVGAIFTTSIPVNCSMYSLCDTCGQNNCSWVTCSDILDDYSQCSEAVSQNCAVSSCEHDTCKNVTDCKQCGKTGSCEWVQCIGSDEGPFCGKAAEFCSPVTCNATGPTTTTAHPNGNITTVAPIDTTTVNPNDTTTTSAPPDTTTSSPPNTTTSSPPDTTTSSPPDTTTSSPDTTTSPPSPNTTTTTPPSPDTTTSPPSPDTTISPSPDTTTAPSTTTPPGPAPTPSPQSGGFSAGSFFGGITLTLALLGVGLGGYKFYKTRYDVNYRTL